MWKEIMIIAALFISSAIFMLGAEIKKANERIEKQQKEVDFLTKKLGIQDSINKTAGKVFNAQTDAARNKHKRSYHAFFVERGR